VVHDDVLAQNSELNPVLNMEDTEANKTRVLSWGSMTIDVLGL
jgi:hypothetical protein